MAVAPLLYEKCKEKGGGGGSCTYVILYNSAITDITSSFVFEAFLTLTIFGHVRVCISIF